MALALETADSDGLQPWLGRLLDFGIVQTSGKTSGRRYFVAPAWLRGAQLDQKTTLVRVSSHRLRALILEDFARYPVSSSPDVNRRIGAEISAKTIKQALDGLVTDRLVRYEGERRWRKYSLTELGDKRHRGE